MCSFSRSCRILGLLLEHVLMFKKHISFLNITVVTLCLKCSVLAPDRFTFFNHVSDYFCSTLGVKAVDFEVYFLSMKTSLKWSWKKAQFFPTLIIKCCRDMQLTFTRYAWVMHTNQFPFCIEKNTNMTHKTLQKITKWK